MRTEPERFDRVLEHPTYTSAPVEPVGVPLMGIAEVTPGGIIATGLSLLISLLMLLRDPFKTANQIVLGLLLGVVGWTLYMSFKKANAVRDAPVERGPSSRWICVTSSPARWAGLRKHGPLGLKAQSHAHGTRASDRITAK